MIRVAIAGHFNPLHIGHINLIEEARKLGDYLIVIVANDQQAKKKRSKVFMSAEDRIKIISKIKEVDQVVLSIDVNRDVCVTLGEIKPDVFASGCSKNHPDAKREIEACKIFHIKPVYNVGGEKIQSSSRLLKEYASI